MKEYSFFLLDFMERKLECHIAIQSLILFEDILEIHLNFFGKEDKLWQLTDYLQRDMNARVFTAKEIINPETKKDFLQTAKIFNLKKWAKNRNIPCQFIIRGWGLTSIALRLLQIAHNFSEKVSDFKDDRPAT